MRSVEELAARRRVLVARAARQRREIAMQLAPLARAAGFTERAADGVRRLLAQPQLLLGAGVACVIVLVHALVSRPGRLMRLGRLALKAWRAWGWLGRVARLTRIVAARGT